MTGAQRGARGAITPSCYPSRRATARRENETRERDARTRTSMDTTARVARWLTGTVRGPHTESVPHHVCTLNSTLQALRLLSSYQQHQIPPNVPQNKLQEVVQRFAEHFDRLKTLWKMILRQVATGPSSRAMVAWRCVCRQVNY